MTEWSLFVSKTTHSLTQQFQVYAPTSNAEEAEVERFYEDLQDLLELPVMLKKLKLNGSMKTYKTF